MSAIDSKQTGNTAGSDQFFKIDHKFDSFWIKFNPNSQLDIVDIKT